MQRNLKGFHDRLISKRLEIRGEIQRSREHIAIEAVADSLDAAQQSNDRDVAIHATNQQARTLADIAAALDRIKRKEYGTCLGCDEDIAEKRLRAVPWAPLCIQCQEAKDFESLRREESNGFELFA